MGRVVGRGYGGADKENPRSALKKGDAAREVAEKPGFEPGKEA